MNTQVAYIFKIIIVGDSSVGKTSLIERYCKNQWSNQTRPTIGVEFSTKTIEINGQQVKLQIWDTAGQERFRGVASSYYKGASGVFVCYDITKLQSFTNLKTWLDEVKLYSSENICMTIVGNKKDKIDDRVVTIDDAAQLAKQNSCSFLEVSAQDNKGKEIDMAFQIMIDKMLGSEDLGRDVRRTSNINLGMKRSSIDMQEVDKKKTDCKCG